MNMRPRIPPDDTRRLYPQSVSSFADFYRAGFHSSFAQEHRRSEASGLQLFLVDQEPHDYTDAAYDGWILGLPLRASCMTRFDHGHGWRQARRGCGDVLLVPPNTEVRYTISGPTRLLVVTWRDQAWRDLDPDLFDDPALLSALFERYFRNIQLEVLCKNVWSDLARSDEASRLLLSSVHSQLAGTLLRCANSPVLRQNKTRAEIRRAIAFIHDNLTADIALQEIALASGLSVFHFSREFRIQTGQTPIRYVMAKRLELAKQLMQQSKADLGEISRRSGFRSIRRLREALGRIPHDRNGARSDA